MKDGKAGVKIVTVGLVMVNMVEAIKYLWIKPTCPGPGSITTSHQTRLSFINWTLVRQIKWIPTLINIKEWFSTSTRNLLNENIPVPPVKKQNKSKVSSNTCVNMVREIMLQKNVLRCKRKKRDVHGRGGKKAAHRLITYGSGCNRWHCVHEDKGWAFSSQSSPRVLGYRS